VNENSAITEPTRLDAHLEQAQAAVERARAAARLAGDKAHGWSRTGIYCGSAAEVDEIAAQWGVSPRWNADGSCYAAECVVGAAATEAVFYGQRDEQDAEVAA
jgi:predicted TPR repeat methyltransferase